MPYANYLIAVLLIILALAAVAFPVIKSTFLTIVWVCRVQYDFSHYMLNLCFSSSQSKEVQAMRACFLYRLVVIFARKSQTSAALLLLRLPVSLYQTAMLLFPLYSALFAYNLFASSTALLPCVICCPYSAYPLPFAMPAYDIFPANVTIYRCFDFPKYRHCAASLSSASKIHSLCTFSL